MKRHCDNCNKQVTIKEIEEELVETVVNGVKVEYFAKVIYCPLCDESIVDVGLIEENMKKADEIYHNMQKG